MFWIDYKSLQHYFDVLYLNWDPGMFPHTSSIHQTWSAGRGPAKDMINIGENPQVGKIKVITLVSKIIVTEDL